ACLSVSSTSWSMSRALSTPKSAFVCSQSFANAFLIRSQALRSSALCVALLLTRVSPVLLTLSWQTEDPFAARETGASLVPRGRWHSGSGGAAASAIRGVQRPSGRQAFQIDAGVVRECDIGLVALVAEAFSGRRLNLAKRVDFEQADQASARGVVRAGAGHGGSGLGRTGLACIGCGLRGHGFAVELDLYRQSGAKTGCVTCGGDRQLDFVRAQRNFIARCGDPCPGLFAHHATDDPDRFFLDRPFADP